MHWACQFAGIISTPINWRAKADEIDYCVEDCEAKAIVFEDVSADQRSPFARGQRPQAHCGRRAAG